MLDFTPFMVSNCWIGGSSFSQSEIWLHLYPLGSVPGTACRVITWLGNYPRDNNNDQNNQSTFSACWTNNKQEQKCWNITILEHQLSTCLRPPHLHLSENTKLKIKNDLCSVDQYAVVCMPGQSGVVMNHTFVYIYISIWSLTNVLYLTWNILKILMDTEMCIG